MNLNPDDATVIHGVQEIGVVLFVLSWWGMTCSIIFPSVASIRECQIVLNITCSIVY